MITMWLVVFCLCILGIGLSFCVWGIIDFYKELKALKKMVNNTTDILKEDD